MKRTRKPSESAGSLRREVGMLEQQLVLRRQRLRNGAADMKRNAAERMVSPAMLLLAASVGVALEQSGHGRGWSLPTALDATNAGLRLLLTFASSVPPSPR